MCGITGLSVGCPLQSLCEGARWHRPVENPDNSGSILAATWDRRASVRSAPRRIAEQDTSDMFPPELVPVLSTTTAEKLDPSTTRSIATNHLFRYLNFTVLLETVVVNQTLLNIYLRRTGVPVSDELRRDALRMYTDEAYHTLAAADIALQVEQVTGLRNVTEGEIDREFLKRLSRIIEETPAIPPALIQLVFVIISETLISGSLSDISSHTSVNLGVRQVIEDHAKDEGRHHLFFHRYLQILWANLSNGERLGIAKVVPELIHAFFAPEIESVRAELGSYNLSASVVANLIDEAYSRANIERAVKQSARSTIDYFVELGALQHAQVDDKFRQAGLIDD